ncbi:MAG: SMP-30/gluconolactonase/LRE family protein [Anaerolineae bacterium]|nr:SMP-30/gluconolactonase/LRE family protein [Anaerolineae bacterium]
MGEVELLLDVKNQLGEGPMWDADAQKFYWTDIANHCFFSYDPASGQQERYDIGQPVGTVVLRQQGGFVLAMRDGFAFWDPDSQKLEMIIDPESDKPQSRFNDGAVDRQGRFWAGTMGPGGPVGALYRLDTDLSLHTIQTGVTISNGLGWSPDNKIMYFCDTATQTIYKFDFDPATGDVENRRDYVKIPEGDGSPDGLTVDRDGFVWSARWDGWKIARFDPDGKLEREIAIPAARVTSCVFGGPNLDELYITTARIGLKEKDLQSQPSAGGVFHLKTDVTGIAEPKFGA